MEALETKKDKKKITSFLSTLSQQALFSTHCGVPNFHSFFGDRYVIKSNIGIDVFFEALETKKPKRKILIF